MNWPVLASELTLCALILVVLAVSLRLNEQQAAQSLWKITLAGLGVVGGVLWWQQPLIGRAFDSMFILDGFAGYFKWLFALTLVIVVLMTRAFTSDRHENVGAFYLLLLSALLGTFVLASVRDFLLLFIGLELLTFSLYVMAAYLKSEPRSIEAGMKYLIMGSVSSGFLVYGIGLLYGVSGSTNFEVVRQALDVGHTPLTAQAGMLLVLAGLGFKVAAVPFHLWVPDVYEGAPTPVAALLSVGSKMAGAIVLLKLLHTVFLPLQDVWVPVVAVLSALTMCYGNLGAIPQTNIKRLMGYSSIGHAGYLLMGISTATTGGAQAVGYYLLAYLFSNLAVFFVIILASQALGSDSLDAYNGLSKRSPMLAAVLFVGLLSLAGVPPLAGFVGKLFVLLATAEVGRFWLLGVGAVNIAISLYYYMMVVRRMYVLPAAGAPSSIAVDPLSRLALFALTAGILLVGIVQSPFLTTITRAISF